MLEPSELWPQEQRMCAKAAEGGLLDLRRGRPAEDDPTQGREWGPHRWIRAQVLFQPGDDDGGEESNKAGDNPLPHRVWQI
jgi:hypothetical protein